jgi:predicted permease
VRFLYPWSSHLHYVNPVDDEPPKHCTYGEHGWKDGGSGNVLEAIVNYTSRVATSEGYERDIAMRFLVHYIGDAHQPLHLTGRARGGNDVAVRYEGRYAKLHSVWDGLLINSQIRQLANYTTRLPSARIESALRGKTYDAYIRWILVEGLGQGKRAGDQSKGWWEDEAAHWTSCPTKKDEIQKERPDVASSAHWLRSITPQSSKLAEKIFSTRFSKVSSQVAVAARQSNDADETDLPVCPYAWTQPMHPLVCSYAFASPVPAPGQEHKGPLAELDVPEYKGRIEEDKIVQKQLAMAGIRLAAVLNSLLLPEALMAQEGQSSSTFSQIDRGHVRVQEGKKKKRNKRHGNSQSPIFSLVKVTAESIAEVIILSSVGYVLARQGVLDKKTQTKINKLNVSFFTPALLFSKVAFTLNPARLAELIIVPAGFVIITVVSCAAAFLLSWTANLSKSQRNFSIACAITPNSNSLPVALMQSLVVTVPQLHWEEEGEPEDTANGMLGRALTYLVLFSTLGMFLRWSVASNLLSTMDDEEKEEEPEVQTGRLIDHDDEPVSEATSPRIVIRRSTEEGGGEHAAAPATLTGESLPEGPPGRRLSKTRQGPPAWARSFPNSPAFSESDEEEELDRETSPHDRHSTMKKVWEKGVVKPFKAVTSFMTMPLYAATISLIVALIPPLQKAIASIEPVVGAIETAGACSIPLTMVVLGAYFYQEADVNGVPEEQQQQQQERQFTGSTDSASATLVGNGDSSKRNSIPWMRNPWSRSSNGSKNSSRNGSLIDYASGEDGEVQAGTAQDSLAQRNSELNSGGRSSCWPSSRQDSTLSPVERKQKKQTKMERRTIAVAVGSRMILTPLILMPLLAYYAIYTIGNVMDDPVFITSACLLVGSPPALTLAQITSQSAKGNNSSFERLISKTIFVSYAILAAPTTILLVLAALLIAEYD